MNHILRLYLIKIYQILRQTRRHILRFWKPHITLQTLKKIEKPVQTVTDDEENRKRM